MLNVQGLYTPEPHTTGRTARRPAHHAGVAEEGKAAAAPTLPHQLDGVPERGLVTSTSHAFAYTQQPSDNAPVSDKTAAIPRSDLEYLLQQTMPGNMFGYPPAADDALNAMIFEGMSIDQALKRFDLADSRQARRFLEKKIDQITRAAICDLRLPKDWFIAYFGVTDEVVLARIEKLADNPALFQQNSDPRQAHGGGDR
ncbi:hypothetical protein LJR230_005055 [Trinickia sp. LjRoot230]|uniref:hypothetical protein n=1 Tax=Trinickia sp. LjRoot230 TaxID=3342288 RepID=UPI003ECDA8CA